MKECPYCHNQISENEKYCPNCGNKNEIYINNIAQSDSSSFSNNSNSVFIINQENKKIKAKSSKSFGHGIVLGGIIGIAVGGVCLGVIGKSLFQNASTSNQESNKSSSYQEVEKVVTTQESETKEVPAVTSLEEAKLNKELTIKTDEGSFKIKVVSVTVPEWPKEPDNESFYNFDTQKVVSVNCIVENIDFENEAYGGLYLGRFVTVSDEDDFIQEHFDILGPTNGEYQLNFTVPTGGKAKVGYVYIIPKDCKKVNITINETSILKGVKIT